MGRGPVGAPAIIRYRNNSLASVDDVSGANDSMVLIKTITASSSATISFVNGSSDVVLDNTYPIYLFRYINVHPATDNKDFDFQVSTDTGSSYGVAITSTNHYSYSNESGTTATGVEYVSSSDLAQSTAFQEISENVGGDNDQSGCGELWLFNPSSTTYVKHFQVTTTNYSRSDFNKHVFCAGYVNTTSAVDAVQFKFNGDGAANIDVGTIKLYGIKDS